MFEGESVSLKTTPAVLRFRIHSSEGNDSAAGMPAFNFLFTVDRGGVAVHRLAGRVYRDCGWVDGGPGSVYRDGNSVYRDGAAVYRDGGTVYRDGGTVRRERGFLGRQGGFVGKSHFFDIFLDMITCRGTVCVIMANPDYIPTREDQLIPWFANYAAKIGGYMATFGLTAPQVASVVADNLLLAAALNSYAAAKAEAKAWGDFKDTELNGPLGAAMPPVPGAPPVFGLSPVPPGIIPRARKMANFIKAHPNYTTSIGEDLGFIAPAAGAIPADAQPTGTATSQGSFQVLLEWVKGRFDGVDIETQREGESTWTYLAFDSFSPYLDTRPPAVAGKPEVRRYRMRYRVKEGAVGVWSDVIEVLVGA